MPDHPALHPGAHAPRGSEEGNRFSPTGVEMLTGVTKRMVPLDSPQPEHIDIRDIARALSAQVRFAGHCTLQPTIAQHSLAVEWIAAALWRSRAERGAYPLRRAALMHDSAEAYVGDLIGAIKLLLRARKAGAISEFDHLEARVTVAIERRYGCAPLPEHRALIHEADCLACAYEMAYAGWCPAAQPPAWVARSPYLATTYGTVDGGAGAFLRRARALEMV